MSEVVEKVLDALRLLELEPYEQMVLEMLEPDDFDGIRDLMRVLSEGNPESIGAPVYDRGTYDFIAKHGHAVDAALAEEQDGMGMKKTSIKNLMDAVHLAVSYGMVGLAARLDTEDEV